MKVTALVILLLSVSCLAIAAPSGDGALLLRGTQFTSTSSIAEREFADLLAHIVGFTPIHVDAVRDHFPKVNIFDRPNANLLVAVEGVGSDMLPMLDQSTLRFFESSKGRVAALTQIDSSVSSLADLMTLLTGEPVSVHGIHGRTWRHGASSFEAFKNVQSRVPNVADLLVKTFEQSTSFAVSADRQLALALAPHPEHNTTNSVVLAYEGDALQAVRGNAAGVPKSVILSSVRNVQIPTPIGGKFNVVADSIEFSLTINGRTRVVAQFDLTSTEDLAFFTEVFAISKAIPQLIASTPRTRGCDLIAVGVSSVKALVTKYGVTAPQVTAALYIIDAALAELSENIDSVYTKSTAQSLLLGSTGVFNKRVGRAVLDDTTTNTTYSASQVATYQISIWGSVFLAVALIVPIVAFFNMNTGKDSILYRVAGPSRFTS